MAEDLVGEVEYVQMPNFTQRLDFVKCFLIAWAARTWPAPAEADSISTFFSMDLLFRTRLSLEWTVACYRFGTAKPPHQVTLKP